MAARDEIDRIDSWIAAYRLAWFNKDPGGVAVLFAEDALYYSNPFQPPHKGRAAIEAYWQSAVETQSELELRFGAPVVQGDHVAVEWWATMRDAEWAKQRGEESDELTLPGCLVMIFNEDGLCKELREYYNVKFGKRLPPPGSWGE